MGSQNTKVATKFSVSKPASYSLCLSYFRTFLSLKRIPANTRDQAARHQSREFIAIKFSLGEQLNYDLWNSVPHHFLLLGHLMDFQIALNRHFRLTSNCV